MGCNCGKESLSIDGRRFRVHERIAEGGFGCIDLIEESRTRKMYALKRVTCERGAELEQAAKENNYYKLLADHSNIVKLVCDDIVEADSLAHRFCIRSVFTFHRGGNLHDDVSHRPRATLASQRARYVRIFGDICAALAHIHAAQLAHRDLKPHNVLLGDDGQSAVLTDFGSMTPRYIDVDSTHKCEQIKDWAAENCSMFYRAPELFSPSVGTRIDERADTWSAGCVLYSLVYGEGPFDYVLRRGDSISLAVANANCFYGSLAKNGRLDALLVELIKRMIVSESGRRCTLGEAQDELSRIMQRSIDSVTDAGVVLRSSAPTASTDNVV